jgi:N4-gp56 family major capsid protein
MSTDLYGQQPYNKDAWGHKAYDEFVEQFFFTGMLGNGENAIIEHITELTKNNKGESGAWLHLVADVHGGGIVGDNTLENRERDLEASWIRANFDQIRNGMVTKGRVSEQKSVINARKQFRKKMARWLAECMEDQAVLTASGISYAFNTDGSPRVTPANQDPWTDLAYAADVTAPTSNRHFRWDDSTGLEAGDTTQIATADVPKYNMIPEIEAKARTSRITPIRVGGEEYFLWLIHTNAMAKLWQNAEFRSVVVDGQVRGAGNPIFKGSKVTMNNLIIKPYNRTFNTLGAGSGSKWGGGTVDGSRSLVMGAQALAMVDLGAVNWEEDHRDFRNRWALAVDKMAGWLKPRFKDSHTDTVEDFSIISVDHAL